MIKRLGFTQGNCKNTCEADIRYKTRNRLLGKQILSNLFLCIAIFSLESALTYSVDSVSGDYRAGKVSIDPEKDAHYFEM